MSRDRRPARLLLVAGLLAGALGGAGHALAAAPIPQTSRVLKGTMLRAIDGNLIHVRIGGRPTAVSLVGVRPTAAGAGTRGACLTGRARQVVEGFLPPGGAVRIVTDPGRSARDARGRVLGYVYRAGRDPGIASVNRSVVARGLSAFAPGRRGELRFGDALRRAERRARRGAVGRWGDACSLATVAGVQRRLVELGYLPRGSATGSSDYRTEQAVMAFQGWSGLSRDGVVGPATRGRLARAGRPTASSRATGRHVEIHIDRQVALMVDRGRVVRAIHVSTGAGGGTPRGSFSVNRREIMSWSVPFSSWMPYAQYFTGGIAMHEYPDVPGYPASHGCVRMPAPEAPVMWEFAGYGTPVLVI